MRVLITRPEREAATLAAALAARGHQAVVAPLFHLELLAPPDSFEPALAACQAVLLTSVNGARALAEASEQRSKPVFAVGDTTASTAEGLGFGNVVSAGGDGAALAQVVKRRLKPQDGPLLFVSGVDVAGDLESALGAEGFDVRRFALYEARAATALPDSALAALQARALDAACFFSPRASTLFVRLVREVSLAETCRAVSAVAISRAAAEPLKALPFKAVLAAAQPTRQAVLDVIDRLGEAGYLEARSMTDTPPPEAGPAPSAPAPSPPPPSRPVAARRGLGVFGAFVTGLVAAVIVLAAAVASLPYWPQQAREMWLGGTATSTGDKQALAQAEAQMTAQIERLRAERQARDQAEAEARQKSAADADARRQAEAAAQRAARDAAKRDLDARLDDLEKRVHAAAATAAQADRPAASSAIAELRAKVTELENRPSDADTLKEVVALKAEIADLRKAMETAAEKAQSDARALGAGEAKALAAARASAVIGIAARLSSALEQGSPFAADLALLAPFAQDDAKLGELSAPLKPLADKGVATVGALAADFPIFARTVLAQETEGNSFGERLLAKLRGLVSLRRVGADVPGDSAEAKLARAEAAVNAGELAKAVALVKSLPENSQGGKTTWLARAEAHLVAQQAVDQLSTHAVALLGAARQAQ